MHIKRLWLALAMVLIAGIVPTMVQADSSESWSAWLFNIETQQLVRVYSDATSETFELPLPPNASLSGGAGALAFTPSGGRLAACVNTGQGEGSPSGESHQIMVFDPPDLTPVLVLDLGPAMFCQFGPAAFNADGSRLAVGLVYHWPGSGVADTSRPMWEMQMIDVAHGQVIKHLTSNTLSAAGLTPYASNEPIPLIARAKFQREDSVVLTLEPYGAGGWFTVEAYAWGLDGTGSAVMRNDTYNLPGMDRLGADGALVYLLRDETFPAMAVDGPLPPGAGPYNVVELITANARDRYAIYTEAAALSEPTFIDGGQQIAIHVIGEWDPATQEAPERWVAVERGGQITELPLPTGVTAMAGTPSGYAALIHDGTGPVPQLSLALHRFTASGIEQRELWSDNHPAWMLVYSPPVVGDPAVTTSFVSVTP